MRPPKTESFPDQVHLDASVLPMRDQVAQSSLGRSRFRTNNAVQRSGASVKIDLPAIVRVHQSQVPQFRALVEIRHSRRSDLQQSLRKTINHSVIGNFLLELLEIFEELAVVCGQHSGRKTLKSVLMLLI